MKKDGWKKMLKKKDFFQMNEAQERKKGKYISEEEKK